ncbi:hypothetical protein L9F63_023087, partial [Diploptera punctata]
QSLKITRSCILFIVMITWITAENHLIFSEFGFYMEEKCRRSILIKTVRYISCPDGCKMNKLVHGLHDLSLRAS